MVKEKKRIDLSLSDEEVEDVRYREAVEYARA